MGRFRRTSWSNPWTLAALSDAAPQLKLRLNNLSPSRLCSPPRRYGSQLFLLCHRNLRFPPSRMRSRLGKRRALQRSYFPGANSH